MPPSDKEISDLLDDINSKLIYWQSVREDAYTEIERLTKAKHEIFEHYRLEAVR